MTLAKIMSVKKTAPSFFFSLILILYYFCKFETIETRAHAFLALIILAIGRVSYFFCSNSLIEWQIKVTLQFFLTFCKNWQVIWLV